MKLERILLFSLLFFFFSGSALAAEMNIKTEEVVYYNNGNEVRGFLVESGTPGFKASPIKQKFSYRSSPTALLDFKDCEIPEKNLLPKAKGLNSAPVRSGGSEHFGGDGEHPYPDSRAGCDWKR